jgi:hypothetical protein
LTGTTECCQYAYRQHRVKHSDKDADMTEPAAGESLERLEVRYRDLARRLADVGFVSDGTLLSRTTMCGRPGCRCRANPPERHGPYWQWTRKVAGKTVGRRLSAEEAALYEKWIANGRRLEAIVAEMRAVSREAAELLLARLRSGQVPQGGASGSR